MKIANTDEFDTPTTASGQLQSAGPSSAVEGTSPMTATEDDDQDTFLVCPDDKCSHQQWISPQDPDASFGDLWNHVMIMHTQWDKAATSALVATAKLVDIDGNEVQGAHA